MVLKTKKTRRQRQRKNVSSTKRYRRKKYYAGDYREHIINGKPVKCIYPDSTDKTIAAMLGFRKNCSSIEGFVPPPPEQSTETVVENPETSQPPMPPPPEAPVTGLELNRIQEPMTNNIPPIPPRPSPRSIYPTNAQVYPEPPPPPKGGSKKTFRKNKSKKSKNKK